MSSADNLKKLLADKQRMALLEQQGKTSSPEYQRLKRAEAARFSSYEAFMKKQSKGLKGTARRGLRGTSAEHVADAEHWLKNASRSSAELKKALDDRDCSKAFGSFISFRENVARAYEHYIGAKRPAKLKHKMQTLLQEEKGRLTTRFWAGCARDKHIALQGAKKRKGR